MGKNKKLNMSTFSSLETTLENETIDKNLQKDRVLYTTLAEEVRKKVEQCDNHDTFVNTFPSESIPREGEDMSFEIGDVADSFDIIDKQKYFSKTQKWVGHILEINRDSIKAKLTDLNDPTTYEIAEVELDEIPYEDRELISKGAGFYWSLGYVNDNGQIEKKSLIRFQRTKPWEESDLDRIVDAADNLLIN
jgi:hypothetical protein